jgi:hypothetical protein
MMCLGYEIFDVERAFPAQDYHTWIDNPDSMGVCEEYNTAGPVNTVCNDCLH